MRKGLRFVAMLGVLALAFLAPSPETTYAAGRCEFYDGTPCRTVPVTKPVSCTWGDFTRAICLCSNNGVWICTPHPA